MAAQSHSGLLPYHAVPGNLHRLNIFTERLRRLWRLVLIRRSQRGYVPTALLGIVGFVVAGMFDYTFGHSLGLILISFTSITPLCLAQSRAKPDANGKCSLGELAR